MKIFFGRSAVKRELATLMGTEPSQTPVGFFSFIKDFKKTWFAVIFLMLIAYSYWPIEPRMPTASELHEVVGMPKYVNTSSSTNSGYMFTVGGIKLNCELGTLGGGSGCGDLSSAIDIKKPVRASYFWMPTRLWYDYKMLHTLEQNGRQILSPEQSLANAMNSYRIRWNIYQLGFWIWGAVVIFFWLSEGFGTIYLIRKSGSNNNDSKV